MTGEGESHSSLNQQKKGRRKMKKLAILAVALLLVPASAMAGMTAFMNMDELSPKEMATVTGQTGITVELDTVGVSSGTISWVDDDGGPATLGYSDPGAVVISLGTCTTSLSGLAVDAGTTGGVSAIVITTGAQTLDANITAIRCATAADDTTQASLGQIKITDLVTTTGTVAIRGH
jgi:hypothetical protein